MRGLLLLSVVIDGEVPAVQGAGVPAGWPFEEDPPGSDSGFAMVLRGASSSPAAGGARSDEQQLVERLRNGDEAAFIWLVQQHHASLIRVALHYVSDPNVAEDVVQETWLAVLRGLDRFEGRSSLKTWIFRILVNRARSRGAREARTVAFSHLARDEPAVDPDRFLDSGRLAGHWISRPAGWEAVPEAVLLARETLAVVRERIEQLPGNQREVIVLRDIEGLSSAEVCSVLEISEINQRVLLHRARSKVRRALEEHLDE